MTFGGAAAKDPAAAFRERAGVDMLRYLRVLGTLPPNTDKLFIVDRKGRYRGILDTDKVLTAKSLEDLLDL